MIPGGLTALLVVGGDEPLTRDYESVGMVEDATNPQTYAAMSVTHTGDWLIVGILERTGGAAMSVTVNGSAAAHIANGGADGSFWRIAHPGTGAFDVVVTATTNPGRVVVALWSLTGTPASWTPRDTFGTGDEGADSTMSLYYGGVAFAVGIDSSAAADTWSAGLTLDASAQLLTAPASYAVASAAPTSSQTDATCTTDCDHTFAISLR